MRVYPRVYGESSVWVVRTGRRRGLSPRVRGIPPREHLRGHVAGSIPACTGNPPRCTPRTTAAWVYPRVYGESAGSCGLPPYDAGLSPRVRGIRPCGRVRGLSQGSIPACTGNPTTTPTRTTGGGVYPRVYGESPEVSAGDAGEVGLSPRVRGIHGGEGRAAEHLRSIPACTGNPPAPGCPPTTEWVYPRVYGESADQRQPAADGGGLSPRVRGILLSAVRRSSATWSIPACTGNPGIPIAEHISHRVYPRVYGESPDAPVLRPSMRGLSPRVRGILRKGWHQYSVERSIPACTGNPWPSTLPRRPPTVYPRVYGESVEEAGRLTGITGLSPRVRGIPCISRSMRSSSGSIPACTGNPTTVRTHRTPDTVYPRVYGESSGGRRPAPQVRGLSPRVRGIQSRPDATAIR